MTLNSSQPKIIARILQLILIGLIFFCIGRAAIIFVAPESNWDVGAPQDSGAIPEPSYMQTAYDFSFDPFHREIKTSDADIVAGENSPETTLDLKLFGLRSGELGTAILQTPDGLQAVYKIDEEIMPGVELKSVSPRYIVISRDGRLERLTFLNDHQTALLSDPSAPASDANIPQAGAMAQLMSDISLSEVVENGDIIGYRLSSLNPNQNLSAYGIKNGDIITHIGPLDLRAGRPEIASLVSVVGQSQFTKFQIIRQGKPMSVKVKSQ